MSLRRRGATLRDQELSAFGGILTRLSDSTGALAAALVDPQGETVDYAGALEPFEVRVAAAELRLILEFARGLPLPGAPDTHQILVRTNRRTYVVVALTDGYALVLEL